LLHQLLAGLPASSLIRFSEHLEVDGPTVLEHACRFGLEGIVSKRVDLPYRSGRGDHWLKSKCVERQELSSSATLSSRMDSRMNISGIVFNDMAALNENSGSSP
jgi:bifunctional non-homologous end joining protein LigD